MINKEDIMTENTTTEDLQSAKACYAGGVFDISSRKKIPGVLETDLETEHQYVIADTLSDAVEMIESDESSTSISYIDTHNNQRKLVLVGYGGTSLFQVLLTQNSVSGDTTLVNIWESIHLNAETITSESSEDDSSLWDTEDDEENDNFDDTQEDSIDHIGDFGGVDLDNGDDKFQSVKNLFIVAKNTIHVIKLLETLGVSTDEILVINLMSGKYLDTSLVIHSDVTKRLSAR